MVHLLLCFLATKIIIFKTPVPLSLKTLFSHSSMCLCLVPDSQALPSTWLSPEEMAQSVSPSVAGAAGFSRPSFHFPSLPPTLGWGFVLQQEAMMSLNPTSCLLVLLADSSFISPWLHLVPAASLNSHFQPVIVGTGVPCAAARPAWACPSQGTGQAELCQGLSVSSPLTVSPFPLQTLPYSPTLFLTPCPACLTPCTCQSIPKVTISPLQKWGEGYSFWPTLPFPSRAHVPGKCGYHTHPFTTTPPS